MVDEYVFSAYQSGVTAHALLASDLSFGEDLYIVALAPEKPDVLFSAWDYVGIAVRSGVCRSTTVTMTANQRMHQSGRGHRLSQGRHSPPRRGGYCLASRAPRLMRYCWASNKGKCV